MDIDRGNITRIRGILIMALTDKDVLSKLKVIALGNFDGLHIAHKEVIDSAVSMAAELNADACILLFAEHSQKLLYGKAPSEIMSGEVKKRLFEETGANIITIDFNEIKDMQAPDFFEKILIDKFNVCGICCGFNYHFGKKAIGDTKMLEQLCARYGIKLKVAPPVKYKGETISSTRIRKALTSGQIEDANNMLGRAFSYKETVVGGDKRGRALGTPTINQVINKNMTVPKLGVYVSTAIINGRQYGAVTNIGVRPTIGTDNLGSETYIMDFSGNLYGQSIEICLHRFLRGELKFKDLDDLRTQINKDAKAAEDFFKSMLNHVLN
ncbi:MAG: bifunctional riboflavin kinase/FAD synthetase [Oscillospiraceae bacterium]|nr:bifunctional riboflavin kinase/FAD synthetase [Oscillospiraceae bacterium]